MRPRPRTEAPADHSPAAAGASGARIGPNAVTRTGEALDALFNPAVGDRVFREAGLSHHRREPPTAMVDEDDVVRLQAALFRVLGEADARAAAADAGRRTGDYLLANRIPSRAQAVLRVLPAALGAPLLMTAIARHAWTFAGSGRFAWTMRRGGVDLVLEDGPFARGIAAGAPCCDYFAATVERIVRATLSPRCRVVETACAATGAPECRFALRW